MLSEDVERLLFNEYNDLNLDGMWFQRDGAICHIILKTFTLF